MAISGCCLAGLISVYQTFMKIWVGEEFLFSDVIMILFSLYFIAQKMGDVQAQYFDAAGLWWHGKWRGVIEALLNLVFNILFGYFWGVLGIVLATIITIVFVNFPLSTYYTFKFYFRQNMSPFIIEQLIITVKIIFCSGVGYYASEFLTVKIKIGQQLIIMMLRGIISVFLYFLFFIILNLKNKRFKEAISWLKLRMK